MNKTPTTLIIMDGFGLSDEVKGNAVRGANTPVLDRLNGEYAHTQLSASGLDVDAGRTVSEGGRLLRVRTHGSLLIITHSTRILEALHVDAAHVMENGVIVKNGGAELVEAINEKGFGSLKTE